MIDSSSARRKRRLGIVCGVIALAIVLILAAKFYFSRPVSPATSLPPEFVGVPESVEKTVQLAGAVGSRSPQFTKTEIDALIDLLATAYSRCDRMSLDQKMGAQMLLRVLVNTGSLNGHSCDRLFETMMDCSDSLVRSRAAELLIREGIMTVSIAKRSMLVASNDPDPAVRKLTDKNLRDYALLHSALEKVKAINADHKLRTGEVPTPSELDALLREWLKL